MGPVLECGSQGGGGEEVSRRFRVSFPDVVLLEEQVWPDGDGPEDPTAKDVVKVMEDYMPIWHLITDWQLVREVMVDGEVLR